MLKDESNHNRWAADQYPDYVTEIDRSIAFSGKNADFFITRKSELLIDIVGKLFPDPAQLDCLDIGCGIGAMHTPLRGRFGSLTGVDVSGEAIEAAATAHPWARYVAHDGRLLPFDAGRFDFCFTVCVLHHVPPAGWPAFVAEAWRVLRPGGVFAVFEHNPWNPLTRLAVNRCPFDHDAVLLNRGTTSRLLGDAGFVEMRGAFFFFTPFGGGIGSTIDRLFASLPLGAQYCVTGRRPA